MTITFQFKDGSDLQCKNVKTILFNPIAVTVIRGEYRDRIFSRHEIVELIIENLSE